MAVAFMFISCVQEDEIIMQQFNEIGPRWADISKIFNGKRTDNAVSGQTNL